MKYNQGGIVMKNSTGKLRCVGRVATAVAVLTVLVFMITPVSASTCHPGFVIKYPASNSFQYSQSCVSGTFSTGQALNQGSAFQYTPPSFSGTFSTSPSLNQGSSTQFSRTSYSGSVPGFQINGNTYSPLNPLRW